jgi:hypothetical protein
VTRTERTHVSVRRSAYVCILCKNKLWNETERVKKIYIYIYRETEGEGHESVEAAVEFLLVPQRLQLQVVVVRPRPKVLHIPEVVMCFISTVVAQVLGLSQMHKRPTEDSPDLERLGWPLDESFGPGLADVDCECELL